MKPSGRVGKSKNKGAYENINGYGHEEWLLDTTKVIGGYHYSYIQAIGKYREKYLGKKFDISVYSINDETKQRWWIGEIQDVVVVGEKESREVYKTYKANGWYKEMLSQLRAVGANVDEFKENVRPDIFAVIKYKPKNLNLLDQPLEFSHNDPAVTSNYYVLLNKNRDPKLINSKTFTFKSGHKAGKASVKKSYKDHNGKINLSHNKLQTKLYKELASEYGKENVGTEITCGYGNRIDVVVKNGAKYSLYEIKTSLSVKSCIREAIGQLLEYAYFYESINIDKLIVASSAEIKKSEQEYLDKLNKLYGFDIGYRKIVL